MNVSICIDCSQPFNARETWQTRCFDCYKQHKAKNVDFSEYRVCTDCGAGFWANASWQRRCLDCHHARKVDQSVDLRAERDAALDLVILLRRELDQTRLALAARPVERVIPSDQWRRLVQLCHPDRHDNSDVATEATRWLLENRPESAS